MGSSSPHYCRHWPAYKNGVFAVLIFAGISQHTTWNRAVLAVAGIGLHARWNLAVLVITGIGLKYLATLVIAGIGLHI